MKVLNFGSLNMDYSYQVDHIVREGETISSRDLKINLGGKGFNQSVALARAGVPVYHAGLVGEEGLDFYDACQDCGIKTDYMRTVTGRCGHTIIQVDNEGQNSIVLYGGANQKNTKEFVDEVLSNFSTGDIILLQNEINELTNTITLIKIPIIVKTVKAKGETNLVSRILVIDLKHDFSSSFSFSAGSSPS